MRTKYLLASSLLALSLGMTVSSCNETKDIDDPIVTPIIEKVDQAIKDMPTVDIEMDKNAVNAKTFKFAKNDKIDKVITTVEGLCIAYLPEITRADARKATGRYEVKDGYFICYITAYGENYVVKIPQGKVETATINDEAVECEETTQMDATPQLKSLMRTWYPTSYQAIVYSSEGTVSGERKPFGSYKASTLHQLQEIIAKDTNTDIDLLGGELEKFSFLGDGTIVTTIDGTTETYIWRWNQESKDEFFATFGKEAKFQNLPCYVRYTAGTPNIASFVLECKVDVLGKDHRPVDAYVMAVITAQDATTKLP